MLCARNISGTCCNRSIMKINTQPALYSLVVATIEMLMVNNAKRSLRMPVNTHRELGFGFVFSNAFFLSFLASEFFSLLQRSSNCELTVLLKIFAFAFFSDSLAHSFPFHSMLHDDSLSNILLNYYKSRKFHRSTVELDTLIATLVGIRNNFHVAFRDFKSNFPLS